MKTILGEKKQMTQIYRDDGKVIPVTIIDVSDVFIVGKKNIEKDGYSATVLGRGKKGKSSKAEAGKFKKIGFVPQIVIEAKNMNGDLKIGEKLDPTLFGINEKVDVVGVSKGKGFQGVVKRWGFAGGPKTHGQSDRHRAPGSIGAGTTPGRVFKGKKMPGRMGGERVTVKNLKVIAVDKTNGLIAIKGAVPGGRGATVIIRSIR